jgi:hypothetical protein
MSALKGNLDDEDVENNQDLVTIIITHNERF